MSNYRNNDDNETLGFKTDLGFCSDCGSILPLLGPKGGVTCYACKRVWGPEVFGDLAMKYTIKFNNIDTYANDKNTLDDDEDADGPVVERKCSECGNDQMSYATVQLRSADEGQTVFYTCTKCKYTQGN
ncbi:hypothetical protein HCN44_009665 [Aphidius gifuensis]|uniref:DNA-directed RNA polymerase subunit n=1 Tax=Aphidius gifuensis TaxID=684658 RepID=A0A835CW92_APHGI|nr:hypothetical protein HCN44_009665 [Aphidius gifuensis]